MKARINYRSKRTIIIISIAVVLLIAAIAGTVAFVKGNKDAAAAMTDDNHGTSQNDGTNAGLPNNGDQNDGSDQNNDGTTLPTDGDNTNPADSNNNDNNGSTTNDGTTGTNGANGSTTGTTNGANTGANAGTTTGTTTAGNNGANVPNQDYAQTTTVITENPWETKEIGWSPISVAAYTAASKLKVHKPDLDLQKYAYLDGDSLEELPVNTAAQKGETITYVIKITNKGNEDVNGIRTIDVIPEGTELDSISEGGKLNNDGKIVWKNDIKAGETVTVSFKAKVTADSVNLIKNTAKVNGEETPETKTPVITATKTANVVTTIDKEEVLEDRDAKVGETIRYTITVKNTSEVDGTTVITDSIPDGTTLVDGTITENGKFDKENKTITWNNVVVPANNEISVSFDVIVNAKTIAGEDVKSVKNTATVGNIPTEEVETKVANITTVKTSEGIHADGTPVTEENPLHELDRITYTLTATNNGNGKGTVKISDTVPKGTTLVADSIKIGNDTYTEKELNEGIDVNLEAGEKKSITFIVTINPFKDEKIVVRNADAKQDEKEVPPTDDEVIKEYVSIDVNKEFVDKENVDELRPTEIVVALYKNAGDATHIDTRTLNEQNNWKASFTNLDKYDFETQELIKYDAKELDVDKNYTASYEKNQEKNNITLKITNTLKYESVLTNITANKVWNDNENKVGARKSVTFELYADGVATGKTQTATADDWTVEFKNVQKYNKDGSEIKYTVIETTQVEHYNKPAYSNNGLTVTNTIDYTTFKTSVVATKKWIDPENAKRPEVTINLYQNGSEDVYATYTLKNGETLHEFTNLPKYDENGNEYLYTVEEAEVEGYTPEYSNDTLTITNVINQENTVTISGKKTWIAPAGTTYPTITIKLYKNGIFENKVELTNGTTNYEFNNLPKYKVDENGQYELDENGNVQLNKYTVEEDAVDGYTSVKAQNGFDFINTINQEKITINGTKTWIDPQGTTHDPITINLLRDGKKINSTTLANGTTSYEFKDLDRYDLSDGHEYVYKVEEINVKGYQTSYAGEYNEQITNTINQEKLSINGTKTWIDPQETEHKEITVNLLRDNEKVNSVTLANGTTNYEFKDLDKYATDGHIYNYKVEEENVSGYTTSYAGEYNENITNTINQEKVSINGEKKWVAPTGTKFPTITINLLRDGEKVDSKELVNGTTSYSFENLDRYDLINGHEYEYTVSEEKVEGYTTSYSDDKKSTITNTIEQKYKTISGTKTWIAPAGTIYPNIEITLYRNGEEYKTIKLESGKTSYEFKDLETYAPDGSVYNYSVEETKLSNYTSEKAENGVDFINTIKQEQVSVRGSKTWVIPAGKIVPTITINLLRDGEKVNSVELTNGTTSYSFENLDRYDLTDGHEYKYTVSEDTVEGYKSEQNENNFTNTIEQDNTVIVSGNKTWVTPAGTTHPTVTINLLKNGEQYKTTTIANGNTTYEFTGLPKYKTDANGNFVLDVNGNIELNEYTVEEAELNGYTSEKAANGVDFVNTIDQELISISGEKTWVDPEGTTLVHPEITINLIKNGTKASAIKLANGNTKYEFTELPKYKTDENGKYVLDSNGNVQLNRYTIEEENVRNYTTSYNGYNITNTFNQDIQGTVEITTTTTSQTSVKTPLDVVFVLDISGSMNDNDKDKTMVDSVNTAISTIMNENPESRIGVVAYSSTYNSSLANANNATTLLPLGKYTPKTTGKYLTLQEGVLRGNNEKYDTITTNVNEKKNQTLNVYGGTYTQAGIKEGAGILTSANTKFTTTVNGKQKEITRTPVMILLSDGDPTYYNENYTTLSGKKYGNGSDTTENEAYYTIRTANYYKQQITSHYYGTTGTKSKFYTIGLNMSGTLSETILNPTSENVNKCNDEGTEGGYFTWRNVKGKLYDKIIADGSAGKYSYADQSYVGSMTTSDLQSIFNTIINDNSTSTETRDITVEESDARRVNLEGIDTSKEFTLTIGSHSYNFAQAQTAGYVKGNNTDGYYVDISNVAKGTTISISYNK